MDEYLSEKEQIERIREWWREHGWYIVAGVVVGLLALFGWREYQDYQDRRAEQAAALYHSLKEAVEDDRTRATALVTQLRNEHASSAYTDQAGLLVARMYQSASQPELAANELRYVMENTEDRELALIARLRLARVLAYAEDYDEALALVTISDPGQFAGRFNEVEGDIHYARGDREAARTAYLEALTAPGSELVDRNLLQMKLNDLQEPIGSETAAAPASEPAEGAEAERAAPGSDDDGAVESRAARREGPVEATEQSGGESVDTTSDEGPGESE